MKFTCAQDPRCNHYPHSEIPEGDEEWVRIPMPGDKSREAESARHKDCISGLHYVARDGEKVSPYFIDENLAFRWLMHHQSMSVDWAVKYEGYSFRTVSED